MFSSLKDQLLLFDLSWYFVLHVCILCFCNADEFLLFPLYVQALFLQLSQLARGTFVVYF